MTAQPRQFNVACLICRRARWHYYTATPERAEVLLEAHPRCNACGILAGEGHVEAELEGGLCHYCAASASKIRDPYLRRLYVRELAHQGNADRRRGRPGRRQGPRQQVGRI